MGEESRESASASDRRWSKDFEPAEVVPEREVRHAAPHELMSIMDVHREAFQTPAKAELVAALASGGHVAASLVAVDRGRVVGHALLTRIAIVDQDGKEHPSLALAPVAVVPDRQLEGIGCELVEQALEEARRLGARCVVVVGREDYYPRFGFVPALPHDIRPPFDVPPEAWMVAELEPGALEEVHGTVRYAERFDSI